MQAKHAIPLVAPVHRAYERGLLVCSKECYSANHSRARRRRQCPVDGTLFDPPTDLGRPNQYCSDRCRIERERAYQKAIRRLAKGAPYSEPNWSKSDSIGKYLGELESDVAILRTLETRLRGKRPNGEGQIDDEARLVKRNGEPVEAQDFLLEACKAEIQRLNDKIVDARRRQAALVSAPEPVGVPGTSPAPGRSPNDLAARLRAWATAEDK